MVSKTLRSRVARGVLEVTIRPMRTIDVVQLHTVTGGELYRLTEKDLGNSYLTTNPPRDRSGQVAPQCRRFIAWGRLDPSRSGIGEFVGYRCTK
jgi:hypothetical protein